MYNKDIENLDPKQFIIIKGARLHNLKNINLALPRNKFIVITGLSGSGKSTLAFDTLYAEGQRRYVESLSSYARQFMGRMNKPEVEYIKGISPAIAIEQKVSTRNPRSTVGTSTEIYEYVKLLFARVGRTISPVSGVEVKRHQVTDVVNEILSQENETKILITAPLLVKQDRTLREYLSILLQQGYTRILLNKEIEKIEDFIPHIKASHNKQHIEIVIDRITVQKDDEDLSSRISDSIQTAFFEGEGKCFIHYYPSNAEHITKDYSNKFEADGIQFEEPTVNFFTFNNPYGACKTCEGFGSIIGIDEDLVIPDKNLSVYDYAIACWKGEKMGEWRDELIKEAHKFNFPVHKPYCDLTEEEKQLLWTGNKYFNGLNDFFKYVEEQTYKIQYRVMLSRYRGKTVCPDCKGTRLRKDASYVKINNKSIQELVLMPADNLLEFFKTVTLNEFEAKVAERLLVEIKNRLQILNDVGLGYLTLNRLSSSLSGGESQRINLTTSLGSSLVGSMYILDEPSIGLHPRDTFKLIKVLKQLKSSGNTVIVVEHDEEIMQAADQIVDIGPMAGVHGGEIVFQGTIDEMIKEKNSLTTQYLTGKLEIPVPKQRRKWKNAIEIIGAHENNLKNISVTFPLNVMTVVSGVSGSGKTSLIKTILYPALKKMHGGYGEKTGKYSKIAGDYSKVSDVEFVDQNPIGKSSRSNPVTYVKAFDEIRTLFAEQALSKLRGFKPGFFSFNVEGGRCEECEGEGSVKISMQFMADIELVCDVCGGKRYKSEVLEVKYHEKSISDILDLTIDEALEFFGANKGTLENKIVNKLKPLSDVGLGYIRLGQSSSTLSGGEAQRVKLAYFLTKGVAESPTLFIFDEPTTGLHFQDIQKLLITFDALLRNGHSIIVIEHNLDVIKCADWLIDLGPEGGTDGGNLVFEGLPEDLLKVENSYTAKFLKEKLK